MSTAPCKDSDLAQSISKRVPALRPKTQADIAVEAGFVNGNFLSMLKAGNSKLALDRAPARAHREHPDCGSGNKLLCGSGNKKAVVVQPVSIHLRQTLRGSR